MMNNISSEWLSRRVTLVTGKSTEELKELGEELNSRAFFVSKLSVAAVVNPLKNISDDYVNGKITLSEAQDRIREIASGSQDEIAQQLMRRTRATQILQTQRQMARGVAEYQSWQEGKEDFPYIIYHANEDARPSHINLNGKVFSVDDPYLHTHMPGKWDYNCRCWGEQISRKRAEKIGKIEPPKNATYDAKSGFMFNPENAFMPDASALKDKTEVVKSMAECVRHGQIRKIGMIVSSPAQPYERASLTGLKQMTGAMKQIQPIAEESAKKAQWDPKKIPNYKKQLKLYRANNPDDAETLPDRIKQQFPGEIQVGSVSGETCRNAGISENQVPIILGVGDKGQGLIHNWQHHKECFVDPEEGERILRVTLGNPNAQVSVNFEGGGKYFVQRVTFFDPQTRSYCVLLYDDQNKKFRLVSWHRSGSSYGESQWEITGRKTGSGEDIDRKKAHYRKKRS